MASNSNQGSIPKIGVSRGKPQIRRTKKENQTDKRHQVVFFILGEFSWPIATKWKLMPGAVSGGGSGLRDGSAGPLEALQPQCRDGSAEDNFYLIFISMSI